jgi:NAD-dependent SIR2 family protein deacetylase
MKPNIVFFGEDLHNDYYDIIDEDAKKVDLLVVIGSSLQVVKIFDRKFLQKKMKI